MNRTLILFEEDWEGSDAIVQDNTKNQSFLDYVGLLQQMGVKNHRWPLQLHNPLLKYIDPFDTDNLTEELMAMIREECIGNPFYYFREIARAPGHTPENPKYLRANRGNMSVYWLFFNSITSYLIQIRQTGKSLTMDHLSLYLCSLHYPGGKLVNLLTKDDGLRKQNMERVREIDAFLPFYLSGHGKRDVNNTEEIHFGIHEPKANRLVGHIPATSEKFANNVGRGFTAPTYLIDEAAFLRYIEITLSAMLAGGNDARTQAELDGIFYGTIIATTAGKKDDPDGKYIFNLVSSAANWSESFLDTKNKTELVKVIKAASPEGVPEVHCAFNHRQMGLTDRWLKDAMIAAKSSGEAADRDYGNVWTSGTQTSPLSTQDSDRIRASEKISYDSIQRPWPFIIRWQIPKDSVEPFMMTNSTVLAFDGSENIGRDDSTICIRSVRDGSVVGAANINEVNIIELAKWIAHLLIKYPKITWIPENKSSGTSIIDYVLIELVAHGIDPFKRIFNLVVHEYQEFKDRFKTIVTNGRVPKEYVTTYRKFFGFKTGSSGLFSRDGLYGACFMSAVKYTGDKVHDSVTINQILGLVVQNDRIDHPKGGKDDSVISWLLSYWFLTNAKNLSYYGIDYRELMSANAVTEMENTVENVFKTREQAYLRSEVDRVVNALSQEKDQFIAARLEHKLKFLESQLCDEDKKILSADELIQDIRRLRQRRLRR